MLWPMRYQTLQPHQHDLKLWTIAPAEYIAQLVALRRNP